MKVTVDIPVSVSFSFHLPFNENAQQKIIRQVLKHHLYHALRLAERELGQVSTESVTIELDFDTGGQS